MATYDQLSPQQRAIVDLILKRGQSYDQLADTLDMPVERVRELAQESLTSLAPVSAGNVDADWRAQIADYLLNQQAPTEAAATRGHLRRSEAARAWSSSVLDSLSHLYANGDMPTIPAGDSGGAELPSSTRKPAAKQRREASPQDEATIRRRRAFAIAAAAAALLFILLIWPVGLLTGGDDDKSGSDRSAAAGTQQDAGIAIVTEQEGKTFLAVQAQLQRTQKDQAYEVWLYNSPDDAKSLGAQVTDTQGRYAGVAELPADYTDYRFIDVSREKIDRDRAHSGESVLRAQVSAIRKPRGAQNAGEGTKLVGQVVLRPVTD